LLTASVTHELITPLACIIAFCERIKKLITSEAGKQLVLMMSQTANMMRFQLNDLMDRALLEKKQMVANLKSHILKEVI